MRFQGKLSSWNDAKGIGTITWNGSTDRVFVHISAFTTRQKRPTAGDIVVYEVEKDTNGKFRAVNVTFAQSQLKSSNKRSQPSDGLFMGLVTIAFKGYLSFLLITGSIHLIVLGIYAGASLVTYLAYRIDKSAAKKGQWRTEESTLHFMALLGGWPGAYIAQRITRHKTSKQDFQHVFLATVALNIVGFVIYASPTAARSIQTLFS